jgi:hypothetical protein
MNSCKKGSNPKPINIDLNGVYQMSDNLNLSNVIMYTSSGQVTNPDVIKAYVNSNRGQYSLQSYFNLTAKSIPSGFNHVEVDFKSGDTATWSGLLPFYANNTPTQYTVTKRSATGFMLEAVDTTMGLLIPESEITRTSQLFANSNTLNSIISCNTYYVFDGPEQQCNFRNSYQFVIKNGQVYLPMYSCSVASTTQYSSASYASNNMVGSFNTEITKHLLTGDTVVYQNMDILFTKK